MLTLFLFRVFVWFAVGIGHKVKSLDNPDSRVAMLKKFIKDNFKGTEVFDYACQVERITTKKKANLILNVDGTT